MTSCDVQPGLGEGGGCAPPCRGDVAQDQVGHGGRRCVLAPGDAGFHLPRHVPRGKFNAAPPGTLDSHHVTRPPHASVRADIDGLAAGGWWRRPGCVVGEDQPPAAVRRRARVHRHRPGACAAGSRRTAAPPDRDHCGDPEIRRIAGLLDDPAGHRGQQLAAGQHHQRHENSANWVAEKRWLISAVRNAARWCPGSPGRGSRRKSSSVSMVRLPFAPTSQTYSRLLAAPQHHARQQRPADAPARDRETRQGTRQRCRPRCRRPC